MRPSSLLSRMLLRFVLGIVVFAMILFLPAGSFNYWQAWVYLAMLGLVSPFVIVYLYKRDPRLVELRLKTQEKVPEQRLILKFGKLMFSCVLLVPGLDHRFAWSRVPSWLTVSSLPVVLAGYFLALWVMRVNRFASRIIEVQPDQEVISTGPYRIVRHPMYLGSVAMFLFSALALGSFWALPTFAMAIPFYILRLLNEEKVLREELPGYSQYCLRTRFRLVPYVW